MCKEKTIKPSYFKCEYTKYKEYFYGSKRVL